MEYNKMTGETFYKAMEGKIVRFKRAEILGDLSPLQTYDIICAACNNVIGKTSDDNEVFGIIVAISEHQCEAGNLE
jgi:hypothetical protein